MDTVLYSAELKKMRRARIKDKQTRVKKELPTSADGCVCENEWTAWLRFFIVPIRRRFSGCVAGKDIGRGKLMGADDNVKAWPGVCRAKQRDGALEHCEQTFARCDPAVTTDERPRYVITNNNGAFEQNVELPLLQYDMFMAVDIQDWRS